MALLSKIIESQRQRRVAPYIRGDVLDLGCNNAKILATYGEQVSNYWGVEKSAATVEKLRQKFPAATFIQRDLDCERLETGKPFDCILMIALIEHLFNQRFVMEEVANALKPGGIVVITTPTPFGNDVVHRLGAAVGLFVKAAADDHIVIYNRHRFRILANEIGLRLKRHDYFQLFCNQIAIMEKSGS